MGTETTPVSKRMLWVGRIVSALPVLMLLFSGVMKLVKPAPVAEGFVHLGYPESLALGIGILELVCTAVYVIPRAGVRSSDGSRRRGRRARSRPSRR